MCMLSVINVNTGFLHISTAGNLKTSLIQNINSAQKMLLGLAALVHVTKSKNDYFIHWNLKRYKSNLKLVSKV